jgi:hypothetical protein
MFAQDRTHNIPLDAHALAVNQPHFSQSALPTLFEIFFYHARDILGLKWVEIYGVTQRNLHRFAEWRIALGAKRIATLVFAALTHK